MACKRDIQIQAYLGSNWSTANNSKLREVVKLLLNNQKVKQISMKPIVVEWLFDVYDVFDEGQYNDSRIDESVLPHIHQIHQIRRDNMLQSSD